MFRSQATETGEYVFCFDNTFSHVSSKTIFFRLDVYDDVKEGADGVITIGANTEPPELAVYSVTLEGFMV